WNGGPSTASLVRTGQALPNSELRWGGCQRTAAGTFGRRPPSARQSVRRGAGFTHFLTAWESLFRESDASVTRSTGPFSDLGGVCRAEYTQGKAVVAPLPGLE